MITVILSPVCMYLCVRSDIRTSSTYRSLCDVEDIHRHSHSRADSDDRR